MSRELDQSGGPWIAPEDRFERLYNSVRRVLEREGSISIDRLDSLVELLIAPKAEIDDSDRQWALSMAQQHAGERLPDMRAGSADPSTAQTQAIAEDGQANVPNEKPSEHNDLVGRLRDYARAFDTKEVDWPFLNHILRQAALRIEELTADNERLSDELIDAREKPWPAWAEAIRAKLLSFGMETDDPVDGSCDLAEAFEEWVDGYEQECERKVSRLSVRIEELEKGLEPFAALVDHAGFPDDFEIYVPQGGHMYGVLKASDIRKARSLLNLPGRES